MNLFKLEFLIANFELLNSVDSGLELGLESCEMLVGLKFES